MQPDVARNHVVKQLVAVGERLPSSVAEEIKAREDVVASLIEVLEDDSLALETAPGGGHAPIHAATLLRDLGAKAAIEPMLRVLGRCSVHEILFSALLDALKPFGAAVLEPALAAHGRADSDEARTAFLSVLASSGVRDPRILPLLLEVLRADTDLGASLLAEYGDPAALPHLSDVFDACALDDSGRAFPNQHIIELAAAIEELGGEVSESQRRKFDGAMQQRARARAVFDNALGAQAANADSTSGEDPADVPEEEVHALIDELVDRFSSAAPKDSGDPRWVELTLEYAHRYCGVQPAQLRADDLREVLFDLFPRKVSCEASAAAEIVPTLRAYFRFASETLHHTYAAECLAVLGDDAIDALQAELGNPANFGIAKGFVMLGRENGFDVRSEKGMAEWQAVYNATLERRAAGQADIDRARAERQKKQKQRKIQKQAKRRNRR